ncbi:hypothetical protein N0V90_007018 [Kalmusia sp. IMI 367209]|nr:hypothetical protein N0V90_007018 [Kalmusia sp. IMI 367209]
MAAQQSAFPQDLPPRQQSWKDRNCPGMRNCWSFSLHSFSLRTSDKVVLARRICMLTVLGLRTAISIFDIVWSAVRAQIVGLIIAIILSIIGFFFIAWCLAKIGEAQGYRKVLGLRVGRWHFDAFLFVMAIIHVGIFIGAFFGLNGGGLGGAWLAMWLLIFGAAWIATWEPEQQSNV